MSGLQRVLVVDDEDVVREILCKLLVTSKRELVSATGYDDAIAAVQAQPFDAAIIDKNLIGRSGLELTRRLRKEHPQTEVILMSGYANLESAIEAVQLGCFEYVTKPVDDFAGLDLKVQNAIDKSRLLRQQRELSQQLIESELRFHTLFEATPDALLVCDPATGALVDANPAALTLYGYSATELRLLRATDLSEGGAGAGLSRHLRKGGAVFSAEVTRSLFVLNGRALETLSVRDVSAREAADREQRQLEARLRQAQKMDAIGRLASGVSHDFGNLLAAVQTHLDFVFDQIGPADKAWPDLDAIRKATVRGAALTKQLLLFGRTKQDEAVTVDVNALVRDLKTMLDRLLGRGIHLSTQLCDQPWRVRADPDQLSQVVINLAINARDASSDGGEIVVETANEHPAVPVNCHGKVLAPGRYLRLSVRDRGTGMSREVLSRLFEPFFTTKDPGRGTGLGLATLYGIIANAGGGIVVESEPGAGSTFTVLLPAKAPGTTSSPRLPSGH